MAHQGRQPRYQEATYQYRSETYAGQQNEYNRPHVNERSYSHNQHEQQWQQPGHDVYANDQQYSHAYDYDDRYDQNSNGYHGQQYAQQQYQEERYVPQLLQRPQPQQARQYQYDERYRDNGHVAQSQAAGGRRSPPAQSRPGTSASSRRVKQDRILDTLESPKAVPWDNPFGAFPGVKKKTKEADESRSQSITDPTAGRPSTSSSNRAPAPVTSKKQSIEESRPHTSHGRQQQQPANVSNTSFDPPLSPTGAIPLRKKPLTDYHEDYTQYTPSSTQAPRSQVQALPMRPAVQRSATVPLPETSPSTLDARFMPQIMGRYSTEQQHVGASRINEPPVHERGGFNASSYDSRQLDQRYQQNEPAAYAAPPASNGRTSRERPPQDAYTPSHAPQDPYHSAQGLPGNPATSNNRFSDRVPNFAADNSSPSNVVDRELGLQRNAEQQEIKPQIYRKPTYGDMDSRPPQIRSDLASPQSSYSSPTNNVSTPTGGFDFGLPPPNDNSNHSPQSGRPRQLEEEARYVNQQQQFPPRSGSRIPPQAQRPANSFSHPYNQPPRRQEQATRPPTTNAPPQRQPPMRQEYGFDEQGYPQQYPPQGASPRPVPPNNDLGRWDQPQGHRPLARTYTEPSGQPGDDHYNHGYEQRNIVEPAQPPFDGYDAHQPRSDSMRPGLEPGYDRARDMPPPRPRTANSSRAPPQQYYNQPMPGPRPPNSDYAVGDRNHPVPIRPGLMEQGVRPMPPSAPAPTPVPQQISPPRSLPSGNQHIRQPSDIASPKLVTIQELNELRNALKEKPNDDKLGLKFAKRLVEAGTVLASEGGKADPKTTAKNRERYINDAYRTVKKLVANNSAEAIFYLADCYGSGQLGLEVNAKEAFQLYTTAAKLGHAQSTYRVAVCCELGPDGGGGTRRDHFKAVQFYKKAATLGDGPAMFKMGMILLKGLLGAQPNRREGISWLKRAAERADKENPHALHELASLYENAASTDVIIRDERYAMQLYTEAANLGYKYSQWRLGSAYEYGTLGVQIDPRQSIGWYTRAAAQGEHQSEFALSGWYLTGSEPLLAQSDQEAYLWARKAASSGLSKAEYAMGYYTEVGIGCRSDIEEAKKWYFRAAAQSDNRAKERLEEIKRGGARKEKTRISRTNVGRQNEGECSVM